MNWTSESCSTWSVPSRCRFDDRSCEVNASTFHTRIYRFVYIVTSFWDASIEEDLWNNKKRWNTDVLKELNIEKDIVPYFGHVNRMQLKRYPHVLLYGYTHSYCPKGRPKKKWIENICEDCIIRWTVHYMRLPISLLTGRHGGTLFSIRPMGCQHAVSSPLS